MQELAETGVPTVAGDATLEATLLSANVQHARGLVSCLNDDAHNVYTVLTARTLSPDLFIVARATEEGAERRILQAGANRVVNPYQLGGTRLAAADVRQRWGLGVVAVQRDGEVVASPPADFTLRAGDVLVVFGSRKQIAAFDDECG